MARLHSEDTSLVFHDTLRNEGIYSGENYKLQEPIMLLHSLLF
jgi:hypothetical protein